ncbi:MAG: nucleotidyltransferase domain-containing protein [Eubacterium sp.]
MKKQLEIFNKEVTSLKAQSDVKGILLTGSVAYATATENSDLDIIILCNRNEFISKYIDGILVEEHFHTFDNMNKSLDNNPSDVYKYLYSKTAFDDGRLTEIINKAHQIFNNYKTTEKNMNEIKYWLSATKIKLNSAIIENDLLKISYLLSTNSWEVLKGVWQ